MRLSDTYLEKTDTPMLELTVRVININLPADHPLLKKCRPMFEYSWFMNCIRERQDSGQSRDEAIIGAMKDAG